MSLVTYALVTLDDVKSFLGITGSTYDTLLTMLINMSTDHVETRCGRRFDDTTYTEEEYSGLGVKTLALDEFPITDTETFKLEINRASDNSDDWEEVDADEYWVDDDTGIITKTTSFNKGTKNWRATFSAGYKTIPYDLQWLAMNLISETFNKRNTQGIESEALGDRTVKFQLSSIIDNNSEYSQMLNNYRKIPVC